MHSAGWTTVDVKEVIVAKRCATIFSKSTIRRECKGPEKKKANLLVATLVTGLATLLQRGSVV